ncbi:phosphoinositide 3-kinase adapter protein 1-like isoform x3 protein [Lasius niger]|uniref:Phosphoinositide 3-kinase adapter protein 1-like isoform x3 protein n=1 Tax=Lasius niger TaxID=67767 RepID=A0A0J7NTL6_LASNI|nr:phosphoinositide 3-kinase adapter protein 1-like isoform x3 protein [Lasius niger]
MCQNFSYNRTSSNSSTKSREPSGPQDELLEIINDFKNNVFTISEVERLVENWQKRNDVQQSFKDKQRQLTAMREEYDRIQKRLKEEMKTPTPFDKIRKFFSKGKKGKRNRISIFLESFSVIFM